MDRPPPDFPEHFDAGFLPFQGSVRVHQEINVRVEVVLALDALYYAIGFIEGATRGDVPAFLYREADRLREFLGIADQKDVAP